MGELTDQMRFAPMVSEKVFFSDNQALNHRPPSILIRATPLHETYLEAGWKTLHTAGRKHIDQCRNAKCFTIERAPG